MVGSRAWVESGFPPAREWGKGEGVEAVVGDGCLWFGLGVESQR